MSGGSTKLARLIRNLGNSIGRWCEFLGRSPTGGCTLFIFVAVDDSLLSSSGASAVLLQALSPASIILFVICEDRYASISLDDSIAGLVFICFCFFLLFDCSVASVPAANNWNSSSTANTNEGWGLIQWNFSLNSSLFESTQLFPSFSISSTLDEGAPDKPEFRNNVAAAGAILGDELETYRASIPTSTSELETVVDISLRDSPLFLCRSSKVDHDWMPSIMQYVGSRDCAFVTGWYLILWRWRTPSLSSTKIIICIVACSVRCEILCSRHIIADAPAKFLKLNLKLAPYVWRGNL